MPGPKNKPTGWMDPKFFKILDPNITPEDKLRLTREIAMTYPKQFNAGMDKSFPDEYRATRKLANTLIQAYPQRYPNTTADQLVDMMAKIGQVESGQDNIAQKVWDKKSKKYVSGPGRGYFQIETTSAPTYGTTYKNYQSNYLQDYNAVPLPQIKVPKSGDVRSLSKDQQASLALSKISARAGKKEAVIDPNDAMNVWLDYHWAGPADQREARKAHWEEVMKSIQQVPRSSQRYGGEITKEGKRARKYGPRPDYMNTNPPNTTTRPNTQRSIGNTSNGGYMSFGDGGWVYPTNTAFPQYKNGGKSKKARTEIPGARELWSAYRDPNTVVAIPNPEMPGDTNRFFVGRPQLSGTMYVNDMNPTPATSKMNIYQLMQDPNYSRVYQDSSLVNKYIPQYADGGVAMSSPLNVPQGYFLNPGQSRVHPTVFYPSYTPGQNAAKGTAEQDYTLDQIFMPIPKIGRAIGTAAKTAVKKGEEVLTKKALQNAAKFKEEKIFPIDADFISLKETPGNKYNINQVLAEQNYGQGEITSLGNLNDRILDAYYSKGAGSTDVPSFNAQLNDFRRSAIQGTKPLEKNVKGPFNISKNVATGSQGNPLTRYRSFSPEELGFSENTIGPFGKTQLVPMYKEAPRFPGSEAREMMPVDAMDMFRRYYSPHKKGGWVGYPDHTMYSSGMERFDRVRNYTKYKQGGSVTWQIID